MERTVKQVSRVFEGVIWRTDPEQPTIIELFGSRSRPQSRTHYHFGTLV